MRKLTKKDEDISGKWGQSNFTLRKFSKMFHDNENSQDNILEVDPTLERTMAIHWGLEKNAPSTV